MNYYSKSLELTVLCVKMKGKASTLSLYVEGNDDVTNAHVVLFPRHIKMSLGGRFGGAFSPKFFFGRDCDDILRDNQADPLEKCA